MILRLIGPNDELQYEYWQSEAAPAVVCTEDRVWVRGASSTIDNNMYFEQSSYVQLPLTTLYKVK